MDKLKNPNLSNYPFYQDIGGVFRAVLDFKPKVVFVKISRNAFKFHRNGNFSS